MKQILCVYKPLGWTSLQVVTAVKKQKPELKNETISYAGRLDPMAEGLLLLLIGDENKKRKDYETLEKTYEVEFFCGVATDSYDILGKIMDYSITNNQAAVQIKKLLPSLVGIVEQPFPPYSSYKIKRKPLFYYAKNNLLHTIEIPKKTRTINNISMDRTRMISKKEIKKNIYERINLVEGNFRQEEIKTVWTHYFEKTEQKNFELISLTVTCSSGTYMRSLVHTIGEKIKIPTVTYSIKRTKIQNFTLTDGITLSTKKA